MVESRMSVQDEFLEMGADQARSHLEGRTAEERASLSYLYEARHGVKLSPADSRAPAYATPGDDVGVGSPGLGWAAWLLLLAGAALAVFAFTFNVSIEAGGAYGLPDRVANLDRIALRHMLLTTGLAMFVSGWVLVGARHIAKSARGA